MLLMRLSSDNANFMVGNDLSQKKMKTTPGSMLFSILYEDNFSKSVFGNFSFYSYKKACGQKKTVRGSKNSRRLSNGTPAI